MKVLYVAPRFHTNQIPVVRGWIRNGHRVMFISQFAGKGENYDDLHPFVLGYSKLFDIGMVLYKRLICHGICSEKQEFDIRIKLGFPPLIRLIRVVKAFRPDMVIVRERSLYNIPVYLLCKWYHIKSILYNQSPLWDNSERDRSLGRRLLLSMLPRQRMTPVYGNPYMQGNVKMENSYFVPFIEEPYRERTTASYCKNGEVRILCIARYEERKRLFMLLDAVIEFIKQGIVILKIAGEAVDEEQNAYYMKLKRYIRDNELEERVSLYTNLSRNHVFELYCQSDIFVLPSTKERASIAQLEAMSCSLPVICSDTNGSACYIKAGVNGYLFKDDDRNDLKVKIGYLLKNKKQISIMGQAGYSMVKNQYNFENYYKAIMAIKD